MTTNEGSQFPIDTICVINNEKSFIRKYLINKKTYLFGVLNNYNLFYREIHLKSKRNVKKNQKIVSSYYLTIGS